ncbi:hypothetical protein [Streptomyces sp. SP18CS02]|uniref:hypothetical protein n=1 Tax=Streptomyces sp. SP18CS02 TaxID=3002531 RepID=UPI002E776E64|nr:hypothetical protein [Streptomyces sp. SP18CS02]MEE1757486.1 hypothetical protein [Streptomyces sp. SP18CS02]
MRVISTVLPVAPALLLLTGCSVPEDRIRAVSSTAVAFSARVQAHDPAGACELLAPQTREELAQDPGPTCADGLEDAAPPDGGEVRSTQVYGHRARVVLDQDTYFLTSFPDGWKISAAGCTPRPGRPYRCQVKGD